MRLHVLEDLVIALVQLGDQDVQQQDGNDGYKGAHRDHHRHVGIKVAVVFGREPRLVLDFFGLRTA